MPHAQDRLVKSSRWIVRIAILANRWFFTAVLAGLLVSFLMPAVFAALLVSPAPGIDPRSTVLGMRWLMMLGLVMSLATERLLAALAQIVASAGVGEPFIAANTRRLRTIGWTLLFLQLLDIPGAVIARFFPMLGSGSAGIPFSPGGWLAVLMVFVLSRVFASGSVMRDELEGTV